MTDSDKGLQIPGVWQSEAITRQIMNAALDAIVCMDSAGIIRVWTPQAENIFGWKEAEILGKTVSETIIPPAFWERHKNGLHHYLKTGQGPLINRLIEVMALNKEGNEFPVELTIAPIAQGTTHFFCAFIRDISERKNVEQAIKESEEKYRTLVEQAVDAIALYDATGKILDVNTGSVNLLGYSKDELMQMTLPDILTDEEIKAKPVQYNVLQEGNSTVKQRKMRRKNGSIVETEVRSQQLPDGRFLSVIRDLSERLESLQQIEKEKELSDSIISSLPGIFYLYDQTGKFLRWNKKFEEVTGYSTEEISYMHPLDFFEGEDREYIRIRIADAFENGYCEAEANFITKSGDKIPFYFTGSSIINDGKPCLLGTGIDITLRKKAQDLIIREKELSNEIIDSIPGVFFLFDEDLRYLRWNKQFESISGYSSVEIEQLHAVNDFYDENERIKVMEAINEAFTKGIATVEANARRKDGRKTPLYLTGKLITFEGKQCLIGTGIDITDRKRSEEQIKYSYQQIRRLTEHLQNIREEERTHIAREIHDELGQHLTVLKMDVAWLNKKIELTADKTVQHKINELLAMLDGTVKTVRRISSELRPSLLDDLGLTAAIEWQLNEFEKRAGISTHFIHPSEEIKLGDSVKTALFRIFQESLTNVGRHSDAKKVTVAITRKHGNLVLSIADNGKGFDKQKVNDKKTLGILGMNERTSMIDGTYEIISTPGIGTTVTVKIPFNKN